MIMGIGIDHIEVERIADRIKQSDDFRKLVFSAREINYCETKADKFQHYAARFAAKEALFKALGTGWTTDTAFNEVEIISGEDGRPMLTLSGDTQKTIEGAFGVIKIFVSLSHLKTTAMAVVIIEQ
jgi:holo-[acyl-carrier protein] synthase